MNRESAGEGARLPKDPSFRRSGSCTRGIDENLSNIGQMSAPTACPTCRLEHHASESWHVNALRTAPEVREAEELTLLFREFAGLVSLCRRDHGRGPIAVQGWNVRGFERG